MTCHPSNTHSINQPEADFRFGGAGQAVRRTFVYPQMAQASSLVPYPTSSTSESTTPMTSLTMYNRTIISMPDKLSGVR
ncbi:hypothetical protein [Rhodohalobacter sulfatireducens]|uniref:Uncharacterized protein n=1 Tax=Rhodohalobacter sulfatireducens TaxID=2911366 RepID=A0ABS9KHM0_9BACT|nr:hypothetical protein [Rhodohalobacter sulfatireducens]MCG2590335.1 hypothetical protein [Rhodohalobacter sulfatireducens]